MSQVLTEGAKELLREPVHAHTASIDGDDVIFNTAEGRVKARNLRANPNVAISVVDPNNAYRVIALRGTVIKMTHDGADEHIDFLAPSHTSTSASTTPTAGKASSESKSGSAPSGSRCNRARRTRR